MSHRLYFSAKDLKEALDDLGPPGDRAEATVKAACLTLIDLIEDDSQWEVTIAADPAAALQAGLPRVTIVQLEMPGIEDYA